MAYPTLDTFVSVLKDQISAPKADLEQNLRSILEEFIEKMDVVSKQELARHQTVLNQAMQRIETLEQQLSQLEVAQETTKKNAE